MSAYKPHYEFHPSPTPLEGTLSTDPGYEDYIGSDDLASIISFLRHDGSYIGDLFHAHGRNVTVPLHQPRSNLYDSVQISGGAYIPIGLDSNTDSNSGVLTIDPTKPKNIYPPAQTSKQFVHSYHVLANGELVERQESSPMGSYSQKLVKYKKSMTARSSRIESAVLIVPGVIGSYAFPDLPDGKEGNTTALLLAVPCGGKRTDSETISPLIGTCQQRPNLLEAALDTHMPSIMRTLALIGEVALDIHAAGYIHNELTLGNVLPIRATQDKDYMYVADWETATPLNNMDDLLPRVFEIVVAFRSFAGVISRLRTDANLPVDKGVAILTEGLVVLLAGYYGLEAQDAYNFLRRDPNLFRDGLAAAHRASPKVKNFLPFITMITQLEKYAISKT